MVPPTATSLSVAKDSTPFIVCARAMPSSAARHQLLTKSLQSIWGAAWISATRSTQVDLQDSVSWQWTAQAAQRTTIFTCWRVYNQPVSLQGLTSYSHAVQMVA